MAVSIVKSKYVWFKKLSSFLNINSFEREGFVMEANTTKDYAQQTIEVIGTDLAQQMSSNLITAVLIDVAWKKLQEKCWVKRRPWSLTARLGPTLEKRALGKP